MSNGAAMRVQAGRPPRRRMAPAEREQQIVDEAIRFFAENGFEGQTRELARRLGVTQPLLYRYFPDKEALIDRVYREVFVSRWRPEWEALLCDRARPLGDRLVDFYRQYAAAIFRYEWVRIFMFAGLKDVNINARYLQLIRERVLRPICAELRAQAGLPPPCELPLTELEMECAWALHGGIFYVAIRKFVYHLPVEDDLGTIVEAQVAGFLRGAADAMRLLSTAGRGPGAGGGREQARGEP